MRKLKGLLGILLLIGVAFSPVMAANLYWKTTLADLTAIAGASDGDRGLVIGPAGDVTFYLHSGGLWIPATTSVSWNLVTDRPTINGVTITGAVLDNASNYPTLNQNTTGNAATATTLSGAVSWDNITNKPTIGGVEIIGAVLDNSGLYPILNQSTVGNAATATTADSLAAQYIDWSQVSGPTSVANRPTINGVNVTGAVLDNASNYPAVVDVTAGGFLKKTGTTGATLGLWDNCASNEIPKWNGAAWTCASDAQSAGDNPVFDNVQSGTNTASTMTVGTGGTLTYSGSGIVNASQFQGAATIPWSLLTSVPTFNSQTLSGAMLDNVSNYPTFNQNTTGTAGGLVFGLDARGDLAVRGASTYGRLGIGSAGKILGTDGTDPAWSAYTLAAPGASGAVLYSNGTNWTRSAAPAISAASMTSFPTLNQNTTGTAANLSGTPTLPNGTVATTQSQADASTKLATTAYVDTGLDGLAPLVSPSFTTPSLGVATATTLNTGQGANELYDMNQNVQTTDNVAFNTVTAEIISVCSPADNDCFVEAVNVGGLAAAYQAAGRMYFDNTANTIKAVANDNASTLIYTPTGTLTDTKYCIYTTGTGIVCNTTSAGTGDVVGPSSATDNALVLYDGTTGKLVKDSPITVGMDNIISGAAGVSTTHADNTARLEIMNTGPLTSPSHGDTYYDNTLKQYRVYESAWVPVGKYIEVLDNVTGPTAAQMWGSTNLVNAVITVTLPTAIKGMSGCVIDSGSAHDLIVDVQATDNIVLVGSVGAGGVGITNAGGSSTGDFVCFRSLAANKWYVFDKQGTWASQ